MHRHLAADGIDVKSSVTSKAKHKCTDAASAAEPCASAQLLALADPRKGFAKNPLLYILALIGVASWVDGLAGGLDAAATYNACAASAPDPFPSGHGMSPWVTLDRSSAATNVGVGEALDRVAWLDAFPLAGSSVGEGVLGMRGHLGVDRRCISVEGGERKPLHAIGMHPPPSGAVAFAEFAIPQGPPADGAGSPLPSQPALRASRPPPELPGAGPEPAHKSSSAGPCEDWLFVEVGLDDGNTPWGRAASELSFTVAVAPSPDSSPDASPGAWSVLWRSRGIASAGDYETAVVDVTGAGAVRLEVSVQRGNAGAHAVWVDPRVLRLCSATSAERVKRRGGRRGRRGKRAALAALAALTPPPELRSPRD